MEPYLEDIGEKYTTKLWHRYSLQAFGWEQASSIEYRRHWLVKISTVKKHLCNTEIIWQLKCTYSFT